MDRQAYLWNLPTDRAAHARRLVDIGVQHVRVKAGGDTGRLWRAWSEPAATQPYRDAGLRVTPWFYTWPVQGDIDVVVAAMRAQPFDEYALNPETEWRWRNSNENPWNSLDQANEAAREWLRRMEAALPNVRRAFSSVPTWADFPYEAWCERCAQAEPQHYWPDNAFLPTDGETGAEAGEDQVEAHLRRGGRAIPCVPIITASREYDDAGVVALARNALADYPTIAGFSAWEAGNGAFQWDAMKRVYALLPASPPPDGAVVPGRPPHWVPVGPYGYGVGGGIREYYESIPDRLTVVGYPVTEELQEGGFVVQYFERQRIEWHGDRGALGRTAVELARSRGLTEVW